MASEGGRQALVESDFLLGLRSSDRRHAKVMKALRMHREGRLSLRVLSSAALEVRAVLYSRGLGTGEVQEAFSLMAAMLAEHGAGESVPVELADVIVAERLRGEEPSLGFFDSLHAASSMRLGLHLLSSEGAYASLGLPVIELDRL